PILAAFAAAAAILAAFAAWELRTDAPMLDVRLFADRRFSAASAAIALAFFSLFGVLFFTTQYLQNVHGFSALQAGVWSLPVAAGARERRLGDERHRAPGRRRARRRDPRLRALQPLP